jgi:hypothetical protein
MGAPRKGFNKYKIEGDIATIYLVKRDGRVFETIIDAEDLERIKSMELSWNAILAPNTGTYYAQASEYLGCVNGEKQGRTHFLNKEIMREYELFVDHRNHDTLDNRKCNLRVSENKENTKHRSGRNKNNNSGYRNVSWNGHRYIVQLMIDGKNTVLGKFKKDELELAGAFAEKMRNEIYGEFAGEN